MKNEEKVCSCCGEPICGDDYVELTYSEQTTAFLVHLFFWTKRGTDDSEQIVRELLTRRDFNVESFKYYDRLRISRTSDAIKFRDDLNAAVDKLEA
jgi:hypothetical protein